MREEKRGSFIRHNCTKICARGKNSDLISPWQPNKYRKIVFKRRATNVNVCSEQNEQLQHRVCVSCLPSHLFENFTAWCQYGSVQSVLLRQGLIISLMPQAAQLTIRTWQHFCQ